MQVYHSLTTCRVSHIHVKQMTSTAPTSSLARVGPASLESLPAELKIMIMMRLHNKPTLRNLIQASSTFFDHARESVRCPVEACTVALHILHAVAYNLPRVNAIGANAAIGRFRSENWRDWAERSYPYGYLNYRVIKVVKGL